MLTVIERRIIARRDFFRRELKKYKILVMVHTFREFKQKSH